MFLQCSDGAFVNRPLTVHNVAGFSRWCNKEVNAAGDGYMVDLIDRVTAGPF